MLRIALRLNSTEDVRVIEADSMDTEGPYLVLRRGEIVVARFRDHEIRGWWIEPDTETAA